MKNLVKRMPAFKQALLIRNQAKEDRRSAKIGEYVKIAIESVESKSKPEAKTMQLVKARLPPSWSGQEFDRWKI